MNRKMRKFRFVNHHKGRTVTMLFFCCLLTAAAAAVGAADFFSLLGTERADDDPQPASKIEILHSDVLFKRANDPRADVLVGNVKLRHEGALLDCDSARYYKDNNSFYAFGRVVLLQGDTLKLYCDTLDYYGDSRVAKARGKVRLYHRNRRLETKKLEYARLQGEAKYYEGGTIYQEDKVLYSYYGEYNTFTHLAVFTQDAKLRDSQNTITCDVGQYNTNTHISILKNNVVLTTKDGNVMYSDNGKYDSDQHFMQAWDNVRIVDKDKNQLFCDRGDYNSNTKLANCYDNVRSVDTKGNVLECDKGDYNTDTKLMHCFDNVKLTDTDTNVLLCEEGEYDGVTGLAKFRTNVVLTDKDGGKLVCDHGTYDSNTNLADFYENVKLTKPDGKGELVTSHVIYNTKTEIAKIDTEANIMGADGEFIYTTNGEYNTKTGMAELFDRSYIIKDGRRIDGDKLRTYKQEETGYTIDEAIGNVIISDPVNQFGLTGDRCVRVEETGIDKAYGNAVATDSVNKCQVLGHLLEYNEETGYAMATDSAEAIYYYYEDTVYVHSDTMKLFTYNINTDSVYRNLFAYNKVRMFRNDIQGVCDSLVHLMKDSCTYMYGQPIIWNLNQQVFGEEIRVYNNDSTIDWVHVINQAMTIEQVDSVSYNQVQAKEMFSYFKNGEIDHNVAKGNVYVTYFIDEENGARIGMNYTETTELKLFMENKKVKRVWMPAATGTMYPPVKIPEEKRYLPAFAWFADIRPKNKDDIFLWKAKDESKMLKKSTQKKVPLQKLDQLKE